MKGQVRKKGHGWLGPQRNNNGDVVTEYSHGVNLGGREVEIPTLFPGMSQDEMMQVLAASEKQQFVPKKVLDKASWFGAYRLANGQSPFYEGPRGLQALHPWWSRKR